MDPWSKGESIAKSIHSIDDGKKLLGEPTRITRATDFDRLKFKELGVEEAAYQVYWDLLDGISICVSVFHDDRIDVMWYVRDI